ncbi:hypothetical protein [Algibacter sp. 2305UL17-15]|uniref:hypothetical protein n=1 Tax=Algibacter sp. 2305UL17-15 TaxID=3231268 RepID=UPI003457A48B
MKTIITIKILVLFFFFSLNTSKVTSQNSDEKAIAIAEEVVNAMGGLDNYNNTKFIKWDFGKRKLFWDKWTGDVRIESPTDSLTILVNINSLTGKAFKGNTLVEDDSETEKLLNQGKNWWINDSYWLVMPWKLQDPGVNLTYVKTEKLPNGNSADVLQLTFNAVGVTPENKYYVYVDQTDKLIKQWSFFKSFNDEDPKFTMLWDNYQKSGNILLSFDRSVFGPKNVIVKQDFKEKLFTDLKYE